MAKAIEMTKLRKPARYKYKLSKTIVSRRPNRVVRVPPYHLSSNELAERVVWAFKKSFKRLTEGTVQDRLPHFLFSYCITPQTSTGISPAELLMGRSLRSRLHLLTPNLPQKIEQKQEQQKLSYDKKAIERTFIEEEKVYARNYSNIGKKWLPGELISTIKH